MTTSVNSVSTLVFVLTFFFFLPVPSAAQEIPLPLSVCSEQFASDFDTAAEAFLAVGFAVESNSSEQTYRTALVSALNACHAFVANYVSIDPVTSEWIGEACSRTVVSTDGQANVAQTLKPSAHKAECDYLQRLFNRRDATR